MISQYFLILLFFYLFFILTFLYKNRFLILAVDESQASASGCSIDSSVKFVKAMESELGTDFFNRMNLVILNAKEELESVISKKKE